MSDKPNPVFLRGSSRGLSYKIAFDAWLERGTTTKAAKYLADQGHTTARGNPVTSSTIWYAAWKYIVLNPDEARKYFDKDAQLIYGRNLTDDEWNTMIIKTACTRIWRRNSRKFESWILEHGIEKYTSVYGYIFPEIAEKYSGKVSE